MSTMWRLRCSDHDQVADGDGVNHGQGLLRAAAGVRSALAEVLRADPDGSVVEVTAFYPTVREQLTFAAQHADCALELLSEYGDVEPLDLACADVCPLPVGSEPPVCQRQAGHSAMRHAARVDRRDGVALRIVRVEW
jgi:hypothetical protein